MGADPLASITCPDTRRIVREALRGGWQWVGVTGTTHGRLCWPPTGASLTFAMTPSVASWKSLATDLHKLSGVQVWRKGNRKRSRKAPTLTGYSTQAAVRERQAWAESREGREVEALVARRAEAIAELARLAVAGDRTAALKARKVLATVLHCETRLAQLSQPFEPFEPFESLNP